MWKVFWEPLSWNFRGSVGSATLSPHPGKEAVSTWGWGRGGDSVVTASADDGSSGCGNHRRWQVTGLTPPQVPFPARTVGRYCGQRRHCLVRLGCNSDRVGACHGHGLKPNSIIIHQESTWAGDKSHPHSSMHLQPLRLSFFVILSLRACGQNSHRVHGDNWGFLLLQQTAAQGGVRKADQEAR